MKLNIILGVALLAILSILAYQGWRCERGGGIYVRALVGMTCIKK